VQTVRQALSLDPAVCRVWWGRIDRCGPRHHRLLQSLEVEGAHCCSTRTERLGFVLGVAMSRIVAGAYLGLAPRSVPLSWACVACGDDHDGPWLPLDAPLRLSLARCGDVVALAVLPTSRGDRRGSVGLAVEQLVAVRSLPTPQAVLSPAELLALGRTDPDARSAAHCRYWVRKTAVFAAAGVGEAGSCLAQTRIAVMRDLTVSGGDDKPQVLDWPGRPGQADDVRLIDVPAPTGYIAAVAVVGSRDMSVVAADAHWLG